MAIWQEAIVPLVRGLISDISSPQTYNDGQIEELAIYAAYLVVGEIDFVNTYTISIPNLTISPDPSADTPFVSLVALKTAILILFGEVKTSAAQSIKVVDGPSQLDLTSAYASKKTLYEDLVKRYDMLKLQYKVGANNAGQAVLSPNTVQGLYQELF